MLELEYAIVKSFPGRANAYGFAVALDDDGEPTEEDIFFHANDFHAVDDVFGTAGWAYDDVKRGFRLPKIGDIIAFARSESTDGRDTANPWLFARDYNRVLHKQHSVDVIIKTDDDVVLWEGSLLPDNEDEPVVTTAGYFPSRLPDGFHVHTFVPQDEWDDGHGGGGVIPGHLEVWEEGWTVLRAVATTAKYPPK